VLPAPRRGGELTDRDRVRAVYPSRSLVRALRVLVAGAVLARVLVAIIVGEVGGVGRVVLLEICAIGRGAVVEYDEEGV
jgi:integral membrane sensor domain MASE1